MDVTAQLKLMIGLAQIDGTVADREKNFVRNIGRANGLSDSLIDPLFEQRHPVIVPTNLNEDEKFNYLFNLVQLMKIDERLYKEELLFCSKIATVLGYEREVLAELMLNVKTGSMTGEEIQSLKKITMKYLK
ncbi:MAG TPA: TerB family tellurite resistance protein [Cyclobacteriaceae bacterium]|nr:TerB family tellurite resistance protein [Cyclobacteriaceae bacterium]